MNQVISALNFQIACVLAILIVGLITKFYKPKSTIVLGVTMFTCFLACLCDGITCFMYPATYEGWVQSTILISGWVLGDLMLLLFTYYCYCYISERSTINKWFFYVPMIILGYCAIQTLYDGLIGRIFTVSHGFVTSIRGKSALVNLLNLIFVPYLPIVALTQYRKIGFKAVFMLGFFGVIPLAAYLCFITFGVMDLTYPSSALTLIIVYIYVENQLGEDKMREQRQHIAKAYEEQRSQIDKITALNQELDTEKQRQQHFHDIISQSGNGVWTITLSPNKAPTMTCDHRMKELLGIDPATEMSPEEVYDFWHSHITPSALQSVNDSVAKMMNGEIDENTYLWNHPQKGAIYVRCGGKALKQDDGGYRISGYHADVTDIVLAEKKNSLELQHRMHIISSMSEVYFCTYYIDIKNNTFSELKTLSNIHNSVGSTGNAKESIKILYERLVQPEYRDAMLQFMDFDTMDQRMAGKNYLSLQYIGATTGWSEAYLIKAVTDADGKLTSVIYTTRYIHEEKEAELAQQKIIEQARDDAEAANQAKTSFLFNMSHDIRTPMNAIIGFTNLLRKHQEEPERRNDYLDKIEASSKTLLSIINNVLEMARIEKGAVYIEETLSSVEVFAHDIFAEFTEMMKGKNLAFTSSVNVKHNCLMIDTVKITEIFNNILSNAYKYTPEGGKVSVKVEEIESNNEGIAMIRTTISDTGIGMSEDFLPHLFEEFSREKNTTDTKIEGTGLGMPIVKRLVELLHGTIEVKSKKGEGSTFVITLPFKIGNCEVKNEVKNEELTTKNFEGKRALIAEDNDLNAEIAIEILQELGIAVERAEDGLQAVERIKQAEAGYYDLVLMDVQMPRMNGYEATRTIRGLEDDAKQNIPIIAMTANAFEEDHKLSIEAGMNAHLAKPLDISELIRQLAHFV